MIFVDQLFVVTPTSDSNKLFKEKTTVHLWGFNNLISNYIIKKKFSVYRFLSIDSYLSIIFTYFIVLQSIFNQINQSFHSVLSITWTMVIVCKIAWNFPMNRGSIVTRHTEYNGSYIVGVGDTYKKSSIKIVFVAKACRFN